MIEQDHIGSVISKRSKIIFTSLEGLLKVMMLCPLKKYSPNGGKMSSDKHWSMRMILCIKYRRLLKRLLPVCVEIAFIIQ